MSRPPRVPFLVGMLAAVAVTSSVLPFNGSGATKALPAGIAGTQTEGPLKIGVLLPFTGVLSPLGVPHEDAARLAAEEINAAGGVLGQGVEIVTGDTGTDPLQGVAEANRLVSVERVNAIVGALASGVTLEIAEAITGPNSILQISPASTSPVLTHARDSDFLFRVTLSDAAQGMVLASLARDLGAGSACTMFINNAYGQGLSEMFTEEFEAAGGTVLAQVPHEPGQDTYASELSDCTEGGPDALAALAYPESASVFLREAVEAGNVGTFLFVDGTKSKSMFDALGWNNFEGMSGTAPRPLDLPAGLAFDAAYAAEYGQIPPIPFMRETYDAVYLLALAAEEAGSTDPTDIRDALRAVANPPGQAVTPGTGGFESALQLIGAAEGINYEGASGPVDLDENGDALIGGVETWYVDCMNQTLAADRVYRIDLGTGAMSLQEEFPRPEPFVGDVNGSGAINSIDAALVLQFSAGLFASVCGSTGDTNEDASVNAIDAALILQFAAGLIASLPPGRIDISGVPELEDGTLSVGADIAHAPMEYYEEGTEMPTGLDIDLAAALAATLGVEVEFVNVDWDGIIARLKNEEYDIIMSAMTITEMRLQVMDFVPYLSVGSGILVPAGNPDGIEGLEDLCGLTVAVQVATMGAEQAQQQSALCDEPINVVIFQTKSAAAEEVRTGSADAFLADFAGAHWRAKKSDGALEMVQVQIDPKPYGIGVRSDSTELKRVLGLALETIRASGEYDAILARWDLESTALH
jgi:branched-chain amino acid transport system substrate-binding protein